MKALSIKQPWAWAIAKGHKTIETRTWATSYRGELLIVASKAPDSRTLKALIRLYGNAITFELQYGRAIAIATLTDCRKMTKADEDAAMCDVYPGAYSWVLENIKSVTPFPVKGQLGIYEVDMQLA